MRAWMIIGSLAAAGAAGAAALVVEGNAAVGTAEIEAAAFAGGAFDAAAVERLYLRAGFLEAKVEADAAATPPRLTVTEGPKYRIARVKLENHSPLSRGEVESFLPFGPGDPPSPPDLRDGLTRLLTDLADRGYVRAAASYRIVAAGEARADVDVAIDAGERYVVGEVTLAGVETGEEPALRRELDTAAGKPLRERTLARDLLRVIDFYRVRGYPGASAQPRRFRLYEPSREVDFLLAVNRGGKVTVTVVEVVGNRRTDDAVIRRELTFAPGDAYDLARLRDSARRVYNLKYFEEEPSIELVDDAGTVRLEVKERRTYRVAGALAYEPEGPEAAAALVGEMEASFANLGGTGREAAAAYRRLAEGTMDTSARYYEPWIGGVDLFVEPSGSYKERVFYRKAVGEAAVGTHPGLDFTVAVGGGYERVWEEDASRKVKVFTWAEYDSRDYFPNPRRGWEVRGRAELGVKEYFADGFRERVPRLEAGAWRYWPTARRQCLAVRLRGESFFARRAAVDEYYPLGGYADLRGFKEEQFYADRQALATSEYRFLVGRDNRLFAFVDAAYRHRKAEAVFGEGVEVGYGAGFRARTPVGIYGVDYGLAAGDGPLDGKIHISIAEEF